MDQKPIDRFKLVWRYYDGEYYEWQGWRIEWHMEKGWGAVHAPGGRVRDGITGDDLNILAQYVIDAVEGAQ